MKIRTALAISPLVLVALLAVLYFAAEFWLESAGGKHALERSLSSRVGMSVRLAGDLNVRLLPPVGVGATDLTVSDPSTGEEVVSGNRLEADLALAPLLREELDVRQLEVEGLKLKLPGGNVLFFPRVTLGSFGLNRPTEFDIDWSWMGRLTGRFTWDADESHVDLDLLWRAAEREDIGYRGRIVYGPGVIRFLASELVLGSQNVSGEGCLLTAGPPVLNLALNTERLDLDELEATIPGGEGAADSLPFQLNLSLEAAEIRRGDAVAHESQLTFGKQPVCP